MPPSLRQRAGACRLALVWIACAVGCGANSDRSNGKLNQPAHVAGSVSTVMSPGVSQASASRAPGAGRTAGLPSCAAEDAGCSASRDAAVVDTSKSEDDAGAANSGEPRAHMEVPMSSDRKWLPSKPRSLGMLAGFEARYANEGVNVYGSDMASSFVHGGKVVLLFGDTYNAPNGACDTRLGRNDDMVGTLPIEYKSMLPRLDVVSEPSSPPTFRPVQLFDGSTSVLLDQFKVPMAGFSDGQAAYALVQPQIPVTCDANASRDQQGCPTQAGVRCAQDISLCQPSPVSTPAVCEAGQPLCLLGGCTRSAVCVDTRSSQFDGSDRGTAASMLSTVFIGKARADDLATFDVVAKWPTNVFSHSSVRTVARFSGQTNDSDYSQGHGDLLIWGRPAMHAEQGRQARLYLATLKLPLPEGAGALKPRYYAGSDPTTNEPRWSDDAALAAALSMDGTPNGDSQEKQGIVSLTTVSWLPAPINQWLMLYGGDLPDALFADVKGTRSTPNAGSIVMRFAKHPWGPWSPANVHLPAGSPQVVGDAYGPGGIMYHADCVDEPDARCARSDPYSPQITGQCLMRPSPEPGRMYAPAIIDAYTHPNQRGGLNVIWAVSTWLPYAVYLMETSLDPG